MSSDFFSRVGDGLARWRNHEFWPNWMLYGPLVPWFAWLIVRYRSFSVWTLANPSMPLGGVVGESKADILSRLPGGHVLTQVPVPVCGSCAERLDTLLGSLRAAGIPFPFILKPDAAQRGAGVRKIRDVESLRSALAELQGAAVAQLYHPGPYEFGLFYVREPGAPAGRIFSATRKEFPVVVGDGVRSVAALVSGHPRFRLQRDRFFARFSKGHLDRVPVSGERVRLAEAGNHAQGTLFRDGTPEVTRELERAVDSVLSRMRGGFDFGRLDVRFSDYDAFRRGEDFWIIEVNGVTSESTNLYDPDWGCFRAWRQLARQWEILFRIGDGRRRAGAIAPGILRVLSQVRRYRREVRVSEVSD